MRKSKALEPGGRVVTGTQSSRRSKLGAEDARRDRLGAERGRGVRGSRAGNRESETRPGEGRSVGPPSPQLTLASRVHVQTAARPQLDLGPESRVQKPSGQPRATLAGHTPASGTASAAVALRNQQRDGPLPL